MLDLPARLTGGLADRVRRSCATARDMRSIKAVMRPLDPPSRNASAPARPRPVPDNQVNAGAPARPIKEP